MNLQLREALKDNLGKGNPKAGTYSVLRTLISYPAQHDRQTIEYLARVDTGRHPAATVKMTKLAEGSTLLEACTRDSHKRKADNDLGQAMDSARKRPTTHATG